MPLTVAIITADKREPDKDYANPVPAFGTAPEALLQGLAQIPDVNFHVVSCLQEPVQPYEKLAANIWYHGLHVPKSGWLRTGYQGCIRAVRRKLNEIRPDLVHGQGTERDNALSAIFSGFPAVLTIHGNMRAVAKVNHARPFSFLWFAAKLEAFTIPRSLGVVCITNHTRRQVEGLARRTWVVPNAVDARFFEVQSEPPPGTPPIILCVGTICHLKNQNNLIRALDPIAREHPLRMVFLGQASRDGAYGSEFFQLLATRPWCEHVGFVNRDSLKNYLRQASMLSLPSLEDNCPMAVLEAMAAGVPVAAARVGGVPDLVEPERTGLLYDSLDIASIRESMAKLVGQPALARALAVEAKRRALERFHPLPVARRHVEIYREVLDGLKG